MTSNMGSHIIQQNFEDVKTEEQLFAATETSKIQVMEELKRAMRPEFLNRIDEIIMFKPLLENEIKSIVGLQMEGLKEKLKDMDIDISFTDEAISWFAKEGFDPQFGARPLKRMINKEIINQLSKMILSDKVQKGTPIVCDVIDEQIIFRNKIEGEV